MRINKIVKIIVSIMLTMILMIFVSKNVLADDSIAPDPGGGAAVTEPTTTSKKDLKSTFSAKDESGASKLAGEIIGTIINIAQVIGAGFAIIMLVIIGIQYVGASPSGRAEIRKNLTLYIVGAIIIFAASGILGIIRRFAVKGVGNEA